MNRYLQQPLPLLVTSVILGVLLLGIIIVFGATATTRGPIEMVLALFLGALLLFIRAWSRRTR